MRRRPTPVALLLCAGTLLCGGPAEARRPRARGAPRGTATAPDAPPSAEPLPAGVGVADIEVKALPPPALVEDGRPTVTALFLSSELPPDVESEALAVVAEELRRDQRIRFIDSADLLEPPEHAAAAIANGDRQLAAAQAAFDQMDLDKAGARVEAALGAYRRHLPVLVATSGAKRIRDAWIRLASIRFFEGNPEAARDALRHVFVYDPTVEYSPRSFPPQMKQSVMEGKLMVEALGPGKLTVASTPPGAAVYVNGAVRGLTPVTVDDVSAGPCHVTVVRTGYMPAAADVEIGGGGEEARAEFVMRRFDGDPWGAAESARDQLGAGMMPASLAAAARRLHADLIIVLSSEKTGAGRTLSGWLYDVRPRQLLRKAVRSGSEARTAQTAKQLGPELLRGVRLDGKAGIVKSDEAEGPSLAERWGAFRGSSAFWPVVGTAAGVVLTGGALGIAAGAGAFNPHDPTQDTINQVILFGAQPRR